LYGWCGLRIGKSSFPSSLLVTEGRRGQTLSGWPTNGSAVFIDCANERKKEDIENERLRIAFYTNI
jgi:hypothetical protein